VFVEDRAPDCGQSPELLRLVMEVLNRYEAHLVNTGAEAQRFVGEVGADNVGILLDAYHMNIEEMSPADALRRAGDRLWYITWPIQPAGSGEPHRFGLNWLRLTTSGMGADHSRMHGPGPDPFRPIPWPWLENMRSRALGCSARTS
jgi:hypothetical protein